MKPILIAGHYRALLLVSAIFCFLVPNGYFLYQYFTQPALLDALLANPLGLAFLSETTLLLWLFLGAVWYLKRDLKKVLLYLVAAIAGGLAFALPLFLWLNSVDKKVD